MTSTIWIDFNDIVTWPLKHFTGIQRVVVKTAEELIKTENYKLFIYYESSDTFYEIDKSTFYYTLSFDFSKLKTTRDPVEFKKTDTILFLGGSWVKTNLLSKISSLKDRVNFKVVHFIHDVSPITVPHVHKINAKENITNWLTQVSKVSDLYITNSIFSKKEIERVFKRLNLKSKNIHPVRLADSIKDIKPTAPKVTLNKPFILFVSSFEPRKNHYLIYQAMKILKNESNLNEFPDIIFTGSRGWNSDHLRHFILNDPELKQKITWLEGMNDGELIWLYQNCVFTIYPSLYEGWGLPVAESLSLGKFCLASSAASIPEIAGDLIEYHNPYDARELSSKIEKMLELNSIAAKEDKIKSRYTPTKWYQTSNEIKNIISLL